jgi:hypothetical protein
MTLPLLTPTEQKIYDLLGDGKIHKRVEVLKAMDLDPSEDEALNKANMGALYYALCVLRQKVAKDGEDIIFQSLGSHGGYRRVITLRPSSDE